MENTISMICFLILYGCTNQLRKVKVDKAFNKTNLPFAVLGVSLDKNDPVFYSYGLLAIFEWIKKKLHLLR